MEFGVGEVIKRG